MSVLPSIIALGLAALAAGYLAARRSSLPQHSGQTILAARALTFTTIAQCIHFTEETLTGFHIEFPKLFGVPIIPLWLFVSFNLFWIAIWFASISGLRNHKIFAYFASWFLAIAGMLNFVAHPMMALSTSGYFPGLFTSPLIGATSIWLWVCLVKATTARKQQLST